VGVVVGVTKHSPCFCYL